MTLGERVKALRTQRGLSRAKLAHDAGLSYAFVQQLETGVRKDPGVKNVAAIAAVLDSSLDSLLERPGAEPPSSAGSPTPRPLPSRGEIDALLDDLAPSELVAARDLLRVWVSSLRAEVTRSSGETCSP